MSHWDVRVKKKVMRSLQKLPPDIQDKALALMLDLRRHGTNPGPKWHNFSWIGKDKFHCHLSYHYVACWLLVDKKIQLLEVYYVGSRERAPY